MFIVPGPTSERLALKVAEQGGFKVIKVHRKVFGDGESYIRYLSILKGKDVAIIQSCEYPQDKSLIEILFMASTAKQLGADKVTLIMPYFAYSREDKRFLPREAIGAEVIIELIESVGVDEFITFDMHNEKTLKHFKIPHHDLTAMPLIAEHFRGRLKDPFVLTPDDGRPKRAKIVAKPLGAEYDYYEKKRDRYNGQIITKDKILPVSGRDVLIVDDIISTGGTMVKCIESVKKQGARDIYVACTHPLLAGKAVENLFSAGAKEIVGTDTFSSNYSVITVAPLIVEELQKQ